MTTAATLEINNFDTTLRMPIADGRPMRFNIIGNRATGRGWLADLQADADRQLHNAGYTRVGDWTGLHGEYTAPIRPNH